MLRVAVSSRKWLPARWKSKPPGGEHPANVALRKQSDMSFQRPDPCDHPIDSGTNLLRAFPHLGSRRGRASSRGSRMELIGGQPFVFAIVPFHQIWIDFRASLPSTRKRAGQNQREPLLGQDRRQQLCHRAAILRERNVGDPRVCPLKLHAVSPWRMRYTCWMGVLIASATGHATTRSGARLVNVPAFIPWPPQSPC
jgi:hypothetical protein